MAERELEEQGADDYTISRYCRVFRAYAESLMRMVEEDVDNYIILNT